MKRRFPTCRSPVEWGISSRDADDTLEAAGVAMVGPGFKRGDDVGEEDCWADVIDWEAYETQQVLPLLEKSMAELEIVCCCNPETGCWLNLLVSPEEAAWVCQDWTKRHKA